MKVTVNKGPFPHGRHYHRKGAVIDMPEPLARLHMRGGTVSAYVEPEEPAEKAPKKAKKKRTYKRRDMEAE